MGDRGSWLLVTHWFRSVDRFSRSRRILGRRPNSDRTYCPAKRQLPESDRQEDHRRGDGLGCIHRDVPRRTEQRGRRREPQEQDRDADERQPHDLARRPPEADPAEEAQLDWNEQQEVVQPGKRRREEHDRDPGAEREAFAFEGLNSGRRRLIGYRVPDPGGDRPPSAP